MTPCPCGTGVVYAACCEPLHDGRAVAETAERLMRSRFAAYARGRSDYVFRTWHPRTRPPDVEPAPGLRWTGLRVLDVEGGGLDDTEGTVEFEAAYEDGNGPGVLHERSRFVRRRARWLYLAAEAEFGERLSGT